MTTPANHAFLFLFTADTIVLPDSVEGTINTIAGDPRAGGASSGLIVHNVADTVVTKLASVIYWCELYLTRSMPGSVAVSDCQSGPSAAFRLSAIRPILLPWYNQTVFGKRMVSFSLCLFCLLPIITRRFVRNARRECVSNERKKNKKEKG